MKQANLGLIFFPAFDWMISPGHPERQERLLYTRDQLTEEGLFDRPEIREYRLRMAEINDLQRAHIGVPSIAKLITPAHLASAGGCMTAADAVMSGEVKRAFALVRPPGHHAMRIVHGIRGFCTINIEAVMVEYLRSRYGIKKIAVVDTDVHHGDGSQDIFYHDPNVLYISFHQDGRTLYPGTGFPDEAGSPAAWGYNINLPLLPGSGDKEIHRLFDGLIKPILEDFEPELIINSAGQDNHFSDPLASMSVTAHGYAALADKLKADIAVLEGGYSIEAALPYVNTGIILAMAEMDYSKVIEPDISALRRPDPRCMTRVEQLIEQVGNIWRTRREVGRMLLDKCGGKWQRRKGIYYDEEGIREEQLETAHYCKNCSGYITVATNARGTRYGDQSAYVVCLLRDTCENCKKAAYDDALRAKQSCEYKYILLERKRKEATDAYSVYEEIIKDNIEYDYLIQDRYLDRDRIEEILALILETVCTKRRTIRIAGDDHPAELVKAKFMKLNSEHIRFVLDCMQENTTKIRNIKQYMKAALFNAPSTIGSYYTSLVSHDMYGGRTIQSARSKGIPDYTCNEGESL